VGAARITVDLGAVADNTRILAAHARGEVMAVVKADGFGHGAVGVARAALGAGATWLGVTGVGEALALRAAGLGGPMLSWLNPLGADFASAVGRRVDLAVPSLAHLAAMPPGARIHLHLDTGMARDGAAGDEWPALCRAAREAELGGRVTVIGLMSHLAGPDTPAAVRRFREGIAIAHAMGLRPRLRHLAATAATLTAPETHFDLVRTGAGLVGIDPSGTTALRGAMTLTAPVVEVRRVAAGTPVGYDHTWRAPRDTTLALLPVGYADGLPRSAGPHAEVLLGGRRCRIAGRISMDQIVVDTGPTTRPAEMGRPAEVGRAGRDVGGGVRVGDTAVVFGTGDGGEPTVGDWAAWAGTLPHEIVTGLGVRPHRYVIGGS
jgi:alanine racemase